MTSVLRVDGLSKTYPGTPRPALAEASMEIGAGEVVSIIGASGAGKTTLMRCINRMVEPDAGSVIIEDIDITRLPDSELRAARRRIGMVFQHFNLVNRLTVLQNVLHGRLGYMSSFDGVMGRYTEDDKQRALDLLRETGLEEYAYKRAGELSGGQKQRVGIVRAVMQNPAVMLCDEPIASLDPANSRVIMDLIRELAKQGNIGCLINLHQVEVAMEFSDRIIGMKEGYIIYDGTTADLSDQKLEFIYDKPMHLLTIRSEVVQDESMG